MNTPHRIGVRLLRSALRAYLQRCPVRKGKAKVWDLAKASFKRWPELFDPCTTWTRDGHRVHVRFDEYGERCLYFWGRWTPSIEWLIRRVLRPGDVFVDVGANIGYFTLLGAKLVGAEGRVWAFEPSPTTCALCEAHVQLNGYTNVTVHPCAVSDVCGFATLFQPEVGCDLASLRPGAQGASGEGGAACRVRTVRLDEYVPPEVARRVRLVKIDVEGADYLALRGMHRLLSSPGAPDVICEVNDSFLREMGSTPAELLAYMADLGYDAFSFDRIDDPEKDESPFHAWMRPFGNDAYSFSEMIPVHPAQPLTATHCDVYFTRSRPTAIAVAVGRPGGWPRVAPVSHA